MIRWAVALALAAPMAAAAQDVRFCPNRPDLGTSTCTTDVGRVLGEFSAIDHQRDRRGGEQEDTTLFGDALLRTGIDARTEVQIGWTPFARLRTRAGGATDTTVGIGDVRLGLRRNLRNPDGDGLSFAIEPFVTLPTGTGDIGRGDWSGGVVVPVNWEVGDWSLNFTGEVDAETDEDRRGRHFAYAGTVGLGHDIAPHVGAVIELSARRDDDPAGGETQLLTAASVAWQVRETAQLDLLATAGLNRTSPDWRIAIGGAILF